LYSNICCWTRQIQIFYNKTILIKNVIFFDTSVRYVDLNTFQKFFFQLHNWRLEAIVNEVAFLFDSSERALFSKQTKYIFLDSRSDFPFIVVDLFMNWGETCSDIPVEKITEEKV